MLMECNEDVSTLQTHMKIQRRRRAFWPFETEKQETELKVLSVPVLFSWLLGESRFWQVWELAGRDSGNGSVWCESEPAGWGRS